MKKIGFIGAYDKTSFIANIAKVLRNLDYKVLVIDTTLMQKSKYIIPAINPTKSYITDFEDIDFAVGFENIKEVEKYLGAYEHETIKETLKEGFNEKNFSYDYVLIDVDSMKMFESFELKNAEVNYFVTNFDIYSLRKGVDIFDDAKYPIKLTKVLFSFQQTKEEEECLNNMSLEYNIQWNNYTIYFPIICEDIKVIEEDQRVQKINFKRLSVGYRESLEKIILDINKDENKSKIRKAMKE